MSGGAAALFGGTFDPPHRGHLALARAALADGRVDRVLLMPCRLPPHKRGGFAPAADRLAMARLLAAEAPGIEVSDLELAREGPSYTIDTVRRLLEADPGLRLRLLIGGDMAADFALWREAEALLHLAPPLVADRPGAPPPQTWGTGLSEESRRRLCEGRIEMPPEEASSTAVRAALAAGREVRAFLTSAVESHIRAHGLYGT